MILIYWLGIAVVAFAIISMIVAEGVEDELLPVNREVFLQILLILSIIGSLLIVGSNCSLNIQKQYELETSKQLRNLHETLLND